MKLITVNRFDTIANDKYEAGLGEFSIAKHFDVLTYPTRLKPFRGMTAESTGQGIGNIQVFSDGLLYAMGTTVGSPNVGKIWRRSGYGNSDTWVTFSNWSTSGNVLYPLLVEYPNAANARTMYSSSPGFIVSNDPANAIGPNSDALSFTTTGQGFVHPKDKILYIPYDNKIATVNGSVGATLNAAQFTIPVQYTIPCLTNYGNYLAIPGYSTNGIGVAGSIVYLWGRDTSITTADESINWGQGQLKVLNNLSGALIGISTVSAAFNGSVQDTDAIQIKVYSGGTEPVLIKEIIADHIVGSSAQPSVSINPNVNFIYKNRMYFSVNVNPNDGVSNSYYGLWSVGKNKITGSYSVTLERIATNNNSETGVLAAAIVGDFVSMCHTAVGTLTYTINGFASSSTYGATSVYESVVNPNMTGRLYVHDKLYNKQLMTLALHYVPLTSGASAVLKYRTDGGSWTTVFTETTTGAVVTERTKDASGNAFTAGRNFEFRVESTGGAEITGLTYRYETLSTNLTV